MAWSAEGRAIRLVDATGAEVGTVAGTSTSTIRPDPGSARALVFGIDAPQLVDATGAEFAAADDFGRDNSSDTGAPCVPMPIYYTVARRLEGNTAVRLGSLARTGQYPLRSTCVSKGDDAADAKAPWPVVQLDDGGRSRIVNTVEHWRRYKDPRVVRLGDSGKWLMVLMRERYTTKDYSGPSRAIADIVGWVSDSCRFDDPAGMSGPLWLVSSLRALPGETGARYWLGVPTAVVVEGRLYLYYVVHPSVIDAANALLDPGAGPATDFDGIACKRFRVSDILGTTPVAEEDWEADVVFGSNLVAGTVLGPARVWFASTASPGVVPFASVFPLPVLVDPDAVQQLDGTWRVLAGRLNRTTGATGEVEELVSFAGDATDGCKGWEGAWDADPDPAPLPTRAELDRLLPAGTLTLDEIFRHTGHEAHELFGTVVGQPRGGGDDQRASARAAVSCTSCDDG